MLSALWDAAKRLDSCGGAACVCVQRNRISVLEKDGYAPCVIGACEVKMAKLLDWSKLAVAVLAKMWRW